MTPLSNFLSRHLPQRLATLALLLSYTVLLLAIVMFIDSSPPDIIYLDVGKHQ